MEIRLNGDAREIGAGTTVAALLREIGLADRRVAVEVNRDVIPRDAYETVQLGAGDVVEVVHFVGGG